MIESERDHETVLQLLAAFVREHSTTGGTRTGLWVDPPVKSRQTAPRPAVDVQTALTVLGRRPKRLESQPLDLRHVGLRGADLQVRR